MSNAIQSPEDTLKEAADLSDKQFYLKKAKTNREYERTVQNEKDNEAFKKINLKFGDDDYVNNITESMEEYFVLARNAPVFINNQFKGVMPFFGRNLILLGALTGEGKTTLTSNLCLQTIKQSADRNKVVVITNEESKDDVYNRVTSLIKGWAYTDHQSIPKERIPVYKESVKILSQRMLVLDDNYGGSSGFTTSLEGIISILDNIVAEESKGEKYGVVILDYYQNIEFSKKFPEMTELQVQHRLGKLLDIYRRKLKCPLVILSQLHPATKDNASFKQRIEGRKSILNSATVGVEVKANKADRCTEFIFHKNRFSHQAGITITCGFDRGQYVEYTDEFKNRIQLEKTAKETAELMRKTTGGGSGEKRD
jgi:KaiC/GvpD/RAD55 family RecA-like ATPase